MKPFPAVLQLTLIVALLPGPAALASTPAPPDGEPRPPQARRQAPEAVGYPIPRTGDQKLLIVLADFPDRAGLFTGQAWHDAFFGPDGFDAYYREVSYGQLRYTGDVAGLSAGVPVTNSASVAYVRLPNNISYYAHGMYGFDVGPGVFPRNHGGVVTHALEALDAAGFDFAPYADAATKEVRSLVVIFAGSTHRYTSDPDNSLEATAYRLFWAGGGTFTSTAGYLFDNYTFCPDQRLNLSGLIAYVGACAHEHGHALGMPDLYDYSYTTTGAGNFDIMAYGTFGATSGQRPFHFGAFSKELFGWITPTVAAMGTNTYSLAPAETGPGFLKLHPNGDTSHAEYFLLENRQPLGFDQDWLSAGLCPGLVIWHIDQDILASHPNEVNTLPSAGGPPHQGVIVVEADGGFDMINPPLNYGDCADTWTVGQTWGAGTTPNSSLWDGSPSALAVTVTGTCGNNLIVSVTVGSASPGNAPIRRDPANGFSVFLPAVIKYC